MMKKPIFSAILLATLVFMPLQASYAQSNTSVSEEALIQDLLKQIALLQQQILTLIQQKYGGRLPTPRTSTTPIQPLTPAGGESYAQGTGFNIRWSGSDYAWPNHDLYVLDNRAGGTRSIRYIGTATLTEKDVQSFYWVVPSDLAVGYGYQIQFGKDAAGFSGVFGVTGTGNAAPSSSIQVNGTYSTGYQEPIVDVGNAKSVTFSWSSTNTSYCNGYGQSVLLTDGTRWASSQNLPTSGSRTFLTSGQTDNYRQNPISYAAIGIQCWSSDSSKSDSRGITVSWSADTTNVTPSIYSLSPNPVLPGGQLTVYGSGITNSTYVLFDGRIGISANSYTPSSLVFTVPSNTSYGAHSVEILQTSSSPRSNLLYVTVSSGITPIAVPTISSIDPSTVEQGGQLTVYGYNFDSGTYAAIDMSNSSISQSILPSYQSSTKLVFNIPSAMLIGGHTLQLGEKAGDISTGYKTFIVTAPSTSGTGDFTSTSLSDGEKTTSYDYTNSSCTTYQNYRPIGSVFVGRGPVYYNSLSLCGAGMVPQDSSYRAYSCMTPSPSIARVTYAFKCGNATTASYDSNVNTANTISAMEELLRQLSKALGN